jgi:hypothetical protein
MCDYNGFCGPFCPVRQPALRCPTMILRRSNLGMLDGQGRPNGTTRIHQPVYDPLRRVKSLESANGC